VIVVGDVSGKGAPAALYGAMASGTLRSLAPMKLLAPAMMKRLNVMFLERKIEGHFITLTYAIWESRTKSLTWPMPACRSRSWFAKGSAGRFAPRAFPGPAGAHRVSAVTVNLETGDLLAFFSDGITEANNLQQEEFGSGGWKAYCASTPTSLHRRLSTGCLKNSKTSKPVAASGMTKRWSF